MLDNIGIRTVIITINMQKIQKFLGVLTKYINTIFEILTFRQR